MDVLTAPEIERRENSPAEVYAAIAGRHNRAELTEWIDPAVSDHLQRPARVLMADRFTVAFLRTVTDLALRRLPLVGAVDQAVDSTDLLQAPQNYLRLADLYRNRDESLVLSTLCRRGGRRGGTGMCRSALGSPLTWPAPCTRWNDPPLDNHVP